eukprot:scaffold25386_cov52-Attheya_sp.AAC.1
MPMVTQYHPPKDPNAVDVPRNTSTSCSFSRNWLLHIAQETVDIARQGKYRNSRGETVLVADAVENSVKNSVHYHFSHRFTVPKMEEGDKLFETKYYVGYISSIEAAAKLKMDSPGEHIGILNSASSRTPGGKFSRGTLSQEDVICRTSLLYACLVQFKDKPDHYYQINNGFTETGTSSSCAIFSLRVPIIRKDSVQAPLLDEFQECSFVSIPAPNAFIVGRQEDRQSVAQVSSKHKQDLRLLTLKEAMRDRLFRALCIFAQHGCTELVLCAFGCGVHGNRPTMVAEIFKELLTNELKGRFKKVVFAIQPSRTNNYKAFLSVFPGVLAF